MCEVESNIRLSWLLVSQFVSWDFCRYMCEQSDNQKWELDVLTFLRNMVVERTEKAANDITKHEIVARFVMEVRSMQSAARMPFIQELSHKVVEKCPELKMAIFEMLYKLKELLDDLEESEDIHIQRKLMASIASEVNKFNLEACKSLPLPNLLQVIRTWINCESQAEIWRESQNIEDRDLYRKVVYCLQEE
ncbi:c2H2-type domain-containing protein [Caerostris darwini]|uniref:C2H2-type domain-containing protein n=1 Tax=Caerostris darwini TaxID=1538125 RepID=A0AAV4R0W9_9ARAC|nr:c2H2-type domain-containing protein [Caerostris darwini]